MELLLQRYGVMKILLLGANLGDLHSLNLRSVFAEFTTSGTANADGKLMNYDKIDQMIPIVN
jgi:hypothetical protein